MSRPACHIALAALLALLVTWFPGDLMGQDEISNIGDFLRLMEFTDEDWSELEDRSTELAENPALYRLLAQFSRLPRQKVYKWRGEPGDTPPDNPEFRGKLLPITGRLLEIQARALDDDLMTRFGFRTFYDCRVRMRDRVDEVHVFLLKVPQALLATERLDERVRFTGLVVQADRKSLAFIANDLEWYPDNVESELVPLAELVTLANWGMDVGSLSTVVDRKPLVAGDREAFYQLLAAMGRSNPDAVYQLAKPAGAIDLLQNPDEHRGRIYTVVGTARRALRIEVEDPEISERLGITHYYEIELFDAQARVRIRGPQEDASERIFNSYPLVFCVRELPAGMATGDFIHENVEITGAYLKLWAYRSRFMDAAAEERTDRRRPLQISPLLIGRAPRRITTAGQSSPIVGWAVGIGFGAMLALITFLLWRANQGDKRFRETTLSRHAKSAPGEFVGPPGSDDGVGG